MADYAGTLVNSSALLGAGDPKSSTGIVGPAMPPVQPRRGLAVVPPQRGIDNMRPPVDRIEHNAAAT